MNRREAVSTDQAPAALGPGDMVGSYRIVDLVGSGGMGFVFQATNALTGQTVALKVMREDQLDVPFSQHGPCLPDPANDIDRSAG